MKTAPLVSIIILSHNHRAYVEEALQSALNQDYNEVEIILVDDGSSDGCGEFIEILAGRHRLKYLHNDSPLGNCKTFNAALKLTSGKYIIDLAADDVLEPQRVSTGVAAMEALGEEYGVHYCDVWLCDDVLRPLKTHHLRDKQGQLLNQPPQGFIFAALLAKYIICTPSMMIRRTMLEALGGYNESLTYEDFDLWIRSSKDWKYAFTDEILVRKRQLKDSLSDKQYRRRSPHLKSTLSVCQEAYRLCCNQKEMQALRERIRYEAGMCLRMGAFRLIPAYGLLWAKSIIGGVRNSH